MRMTSAPSFDAFSTVHALRVISLMLHTSVDSGVKVVML